MEFSNATFSLKINSINPITNSKINKFNDNIYIYIKVGDLLSL